MLIGGIQKFTMVDFPDKVATIVFTQGCNLRCPYCHNPELVLPEKFEKRQSEKKFFDFLTERKGKLDGVVITGGEPTLQPDLLKFIEKIKKMGFLVKLDSNGLRPMVLEEAFRLGLLDYVAMDVKAPFHAYERVSCSPVEVAHARRSIELIINSGVDHEFRTTVVRQQLSPEDVIDIGRELRGAKRYILQKFEPSKTNDPEFMKHSTYNDEEFLGIVRGLQAFVKDCVVR